MTYEYLCTACGNEWEASQSMSEPALKQCPACHQDTARRQVSGGTGFVLKGGGWYNDLYSSPKPASAAKEGGEGSDAGSSKAPAEAAKSSEAKEGTVKPAAPGKATKTATSAD